MTSLLPGFTSNKTAPHVESLTRPNEEDKNVVAVCCVVDFSRRVLSFSPEHVIFPQQKQEDFLFVEQADGRTV